MIDSSGNGSSGVARVAAAPKEVHLRDLWAVVVRHWRVVVLLTVLVSGGAWISGRGAVPRYQSSLTVQVSSPKQVFARSDDIDVDELALRTDPILSEALVLTTQALARRVAETVELQLEVSDPDIFRGTVFSEVAVDDGALLGSYQVVQRGPAEGWELRYPDGTRVASGPYGERAEGPGFSFQVLPRDDGARTVPFAVVSADEAAAWVRAGISYRVRQGTNAVDILFTGNDPTLVPRVLNQAAVELREDGADRARIAAARKREYIAEQLDRAEQASQAKLAEVQQFKERQRITNLTSEEQAVVTSISDAEQEKQDIRVRLSTLEDAVGTSDSFGIEELNRLAAVEGTERNTVLSFQINRLLELYDERRQLTAGALGLRENNPQIEAIDQRIADSHVGLRAAVDAAKGALRDRDAAIDDRIAALRGQLMSFPGKETRIAQLELESSILEDTYRYLLGQYQQARMQEMTIAPYVTILDGASPASRIGTNLRQKIILGFLVGLLLGLGGAFFLEYLDQTVKDAADVERIVGTPVLGRIPLETRLSSGSNGRRQRVVILSELSPDDPAVEAFRALRTNVTFVGAEKPLQLIAVTSPGPSEGKSTTAVNLALVLAQGGSPTLLVDADLRRSQVHRAFGLVQEPGLTDVLIHEVQLREAVRPHIVENLDVLPAGKSPPNPAELLGSEAMHSVIADLRRDYEYIVIDTPPSLPVTDAQVVGAIADATIIVMRSGETEEAAAQRAVEQLRHVRARIAGAVLNGVTVRRDRYYTYYRSDQYRRRGRRMPRRSLRSRIVGSL
ncbi:MAG: polysaccharide biosynthesis tyrosine autokinase [Gemmatimonadota bacterium]|nr:MAG: polysaccharide biosynthesis tyrosine autokinase [Gemmatimonadota bacterium]